MRSGGAAATHAGREEPVESGEGLSWEPLRPELVVEVAYEHMQGSTLPAHVAFPKMAQGQEAGRLHLCAVRGCSCAGVDGSIFAAVVERYLVSHWIRVDAGFCATPVSGRRRGQAFPAAGRNFGDVAQIDADARPGRGPASHGVHQDVVDGQPFRCSGAWLSIVPVRPTQPLYPGSLRRPPGESLFAPLVVASPLPPRPEGLSWLSKARLAALRPPFCENAAATEHHRVRCSSLVGKFE